MKWFRQQRINWIKNRKQPFRRKDLMGAFSISTPQASNDIQTFIDLYPGELEYDLRQKHYYKPAVLLHAGGIKEHLVGQTIKDFDSLELTVTLSNKLRVKAHLIEVIDLTGL